MARILSSIPEFNEYPRSISRQGAYPLEKESLFFSLGEDGDSGVNTAKGYAKNSPLAYVGQTISVVDSTLGIVQFYQIMDVNGTLNNVGANLIDTGDAEDETKGATIGWIKSYVEDYVANNGGGGSYVSPSLTFSGIDSANVEVGETYSLANFDINISTPTSIISNLSITQGLYSYDKLRAELMAANTINIAELTNAGGRSLAISGTITAGVLQYVFSASASDRAGLLTATATYRRVGCYYAYFGVTGSSVISSSTIISDGFIENAGNGRQLCSTNTFTTSIITTAGQYIWICIPSNKTLQSVVQNGFDVTDAFAANLSQVSGVRSHTSLSMTDYKCYRSNAQSASSTTLTITLS